MLQNIILDPSLRCTAKSRRSGWQQCGRLAAYGGSVCTTHGARKIPRFGINAPNYVHGKRSKERINKNTHDLQRIRLLKIGVAAINGSEAAGKVFDSSWQPLLDRQSKERQELADRMKSRRRKRSGEF